MSQIKIPREWQRPFTGDFDLTYFSFNHGVICRTISPATAS